MVRICTDKHHSWLDSIPMSSKSLQNIPQNNEPSNHQFIFKKGKVVNVHCSVHSTIINITTSPCWYSTLYMYLFSSHLANTWVYMYLKQSYIFGDIVIYLKSMWSRVCITLTFARELLVYASINFIHCHSGSKLF